jgi:hypothetical protein
MHKEEKLKELRQKWLKATKSGREIIEMQVKVLMMKQRDEIVEETPEKVAEEVFNG